MKKIISACLFAVLALNFNCNKDEVIPEEQNEPINTGNRNRVGISDKNGNIFDGSSDTNAEPNGGDVYIYMVEFVPELTQHQKNSIRLPYQAQGDLTYFEQCPNNPDKELWHMNIVVNYDEYHPGNTCPNGGREDHPPKQHPTELGEVEYLAIPSCD